MTDSPTPSNPSSTVAPPAAGSLGAVLVRSLGVPAGLVVMIAAFTIAEPRMLAGGNLLNVIEQASYLTLFALAQVVVLLTRGFDLSLGTAVSTVSVFSALLLTGSVGGFDGPTATVVGIVGGLALAALIGAVNGAVVAWLRVSPFVATLGMLNVCLGLASLLSDGRPVAGLPESFTAWFYAAAPLGIPAPVLVALAVAGVLYALLHHTVFGRSLYLVGGNPRAAEVAGVPVRAVLVGAYALCSLLAGIGALLLTARTGTGEPNLGGTLTLESIAAAVVGGASLRGGAGGVGAAVLGALFVTVLANGMNLTRVDGNVQAIVLGCVIVAAVVADRLRSGGGR